MQAVFLIGGGENLAGNFDGIKKQRYGVEIELTGITRATAAKAVSKVLVTIQIALVVVMIDSEEKEYREMLEGK